MIILLLSYILVANFIVSQQYVLESRRARSGQLNILQSGADPAIGDSNNVESLLIFARSIGMIEAKDSAAILDDSGFALNPINR